MRTPEIFGVRIYFANTWNSPKFPIFPSTEDSSTVEYSECGLIAPFSLISHHMHEDKTIKVVYALSAGNT